MRKVWIAADCVISPLGRTSAENFDNLISGKSGITLVDEKELSPEPFYGSKITGASKAGDVSLLESIIIEAIGNVLKSVPIPLSRCLFILSSTKGNISHLEQGEVSNPRLHLHALAKFIADRFGFPKHLVVSNACISGVMALTVGKRMIESGEADHVIVAGADVLSKFVVSGFQSLHAISPEACRPFDSDRKGINLGEGAGAILITGYPEKLRIEPTIRIAGGGLSNDANHISGPSRTGEELADAIFQAMLEAGITSREIDFVSAHGTGTPYNDEMEAKAFTLAGLNKTPLNSLKGYFGHTLGAAGVIEIAMSAESLRTNQLIVSKGYRSLGVTQPLAVITETTKNSMKVCLKTASGFGGCNAAIIIKKETND